MVEEITVAELSREIADGDDGLMIVDIREKWEVDKVHLPTGPVSYLPMSILSAGQLNAIPDELKDPTKRIVLMCHHGIRSGSVAAWLNRNGWKNVFSLRGGIDAYALEIDPQIGFY